MVKNKRGNNIIVQFSSYQEFWTLDDYFYIWQWLKRQYYLRIYRATVIDLLNMSLIEANHGQKTELAYPVRHRLTIKAVIEQILLSISSLKCGEPTYAFFLNPYSIWIDINIKITYS